ncbi:response regulator [Nannocystis sp.]|uniref:response regulator n=1 Tax=Nannocystis sp. TaxID=1962667 RepID=UPI0024293B24|nr:response regulator [Nannocystis sp.]MBK7826059.1 response regulator [Nannocystis sp.]MBK9755404.1 response regulator [Nannocystis sp.]
MAEPRHLVIADPDPRERERAIAAIEALLATADAGLGELVLHSASDGREALALIEAHQPALVLCEVLLAGISGLALLRRVRRARGPTAPHFILITSLARESDRYWGLRNGAHGYVMKPYEDDLLQARIREVLVGGGDGEKLAL